MERTLTSHGLHPSFDVADVQLAPGEWNREILHSINLRDIGEITEIIRDGIVYRSSQVVSPVHLRQLDIKAVMDLRKADVLCKAHTHNVRQAFGRAFSSLAAWFTHKILRRPQRIGSRAALIYSEEVLEEAAPCWRCTEACERQYGTPAQVFHVDLLPGATTFVIFVSLPCKLQAKAVYLKLTKGFPEPIVAAAVADPRVMGYFKLYKIILRRSKARIASALRLLLHESSTPILIHCQHGKDRTGLIVMLLYLLCEVPRDVIVADYARSESLLREGRENRQLLGMPEAMTTDQIIASVADVMERTLDFLDEKYGGVVGYLRKAGMRDEELERLRDVLREPRSISVREVGAGGLRGDHNGHQERAYLRSSSANGRV